jgi:hypothetical protein
MQSSSKLAKLARSVNQNPHPLARLLVLRLPAQLKMLVTPHSLSILHDQSGAGTHTSGMSGRGGASFRCGGLRKGLRTALG